MYDRRNYLYFLDNFAFLLSSVIFNSSIQGFLTFLAFIVFVTTYVWAKYTILKTCFHGIKVAASLKWSAEKSLGKLLQNSRESMCDGFSFEDSCRVKLKLVSFVVFSPGIFGIQHLGMVVLTITSVWIHLKTQNHYHTAWRKINYRTLKK